MELINPENAKQVALSAIGNDARGNHSIRIDHKALANTFVKYIYSIQDMPKLCRAVMVMKIANPGMTNLQIAIQMGMVEDEVTELETIGKRITEKYLAVMPLQEGIDRFNRSEFARMEAEKLRLAPGETFELHNNSANPNEVSKLI